MHSGLETTIQDYLNVVLQKLQVRTHTHTHTYFIFLLPPLSKVRNPLKIIFILYLTLYNNHRADIIAGDESNRAGCQRAYERTTSAFNAAYDYANGEKSLFKPVSKSKPIFAMGKDLPTTHLGLLHILLLVFLLGYFLSSCLLLLLFLLLKTYTSEPYTYRNTLAGALSYFIGTECLILAEQDGET